MNAPDAALKPPGCSMHWGAAVEPCLRWSLQLWHVFKQPRRLVHVPNPPVFARRAGLLDLQRAQEWVVTTKLGSSDKRPGTSASSALVTSCKVYVGELGMGLFLLGAGLAGLLAGHHWGMATYMVIQGEPHSERVPGWKKWEGGGRAAPRFRALRAA